jgi:hypothetical protein
MELGQLQQAFGVWGEPPSPVGHFPNKVGEGIGAKLPPTCWESGYLMSYFTTVKRVAMPSSKWLLWLQIKA